MDDVQETANMDDDQEAAKMKELMEIVLDEEEVSIDVVPLDMKPPSIVDWKIHKEEKKNYYQIIRADGSSKIFKSTKPVEDLDLMLSWDLKTMFEPQTVDVVWRNQLGKKVLIWKLIDSCGVHFVRMQDMHIYMLVKKRYPFKPSTIEAMLNRKLQADHWNEMCYSCLSLSQNNSRINEVFGSILLLMLLVYKLLLLVLKLNAASTNVTTAQRLRLLKEFILSEKDKDRRKDKDCLKIKITYGIMIVIYKIDL
ncbi:hypothetical protein Tco_0641703 [Tanacetum coccineum]